MATYSYSGDPSTSDKDWLRFRLAETDVSGNENSTNFSDEEIAAVLAEHDGHKWQAGHSLLLQRGQKFRRLALAAGSDELEQIDKSNSEAVAQFLSEAASQGVTIQMPAETVSGKEAMTMNPDAVQPRFSRDMNSFASRSYGPDCSW